jgi:hypothetical protein
MWGRIRLWPCRAALVRCTVVVALAGLTLLGAPRSGTAADGVTMQLAPSSVTLEPSDVVDVALVVTNGTRSPIKIVKIDIRSSPRVVTDQPTGSPALDVVAAGATAIGALHFQAHPGLQDTELTVIAEYRSTAAASFTQVLTAALTLKAGKAASLLELSFVTSPGTVNDGQDRGAVVRIANPTPFAYRSIAVVALDGDDVDVRPPKALRSPFTACPAGTPTGESRFAIACLDRLRSGEVRLLEVRVRAHDSVHTGKQRVGVQITGTRETVAGSPVPSSVVTTADVELAVFGVDALSPFGVGTLFVLPGLLAVIVFLLLARGVYPRTSSLPDTIDPKDLRILPIAVPLAVLAYLIAWLVLGSNLTVTISTLGVGVLFAIGIVLGLALWGAVALAWYRHSGRKQFAVGDPTDTVLMRLDARNARLQLPRFTANGMTYLYLAPAGEGKLMASPQMTYAFTAKMRDDDAGRAAFHNAIQEDNISFIRHSQRNGAVTIKWSAPTGVVALDGNGVQMPDTRPLLVEVH